MVWGAGSPGASLGLIAGNGRFPFLLLDAARAQGLEVVVAAIKEETDPEMDVRAAAIGRARSLAVAGRAVAADRDLQARGRDTGRDGRAGEAQADFFQHQAGLAAGEAAAACGRGTRTCCWARSRRCLADEGIELMSSTAFLEPLLAPVGVLTRARADETGAGGHCVRAGGGAGLGGIRSGADGGDCGEALRCGRGDGGDGRDD